MQIAKLLPILALTLLTGAAKAADPAAPSNPGDQAYTVLTFDKPFLFGYGNWQKALTINAGKAMLSAPNGKGGGGFNIDLDLAAMNDRSPALNVIIGSANQAKGVKVLFMDADSKKAEFRYDLATLPKGDPVRLIPRSGASLSLPTSGDQIALDRIKQVQVLGDWGKEPIDLQIESLTLVEPDAEMLKARTALAAKNKAEAEAAAQAKIAAREAIKHTPASPAVERVYAADRNVLAVSILDGTLSKSAFEPYVPQEGDVIAESGPEVEVVQGGTISTAKEGRTLKRLVDGKLKAVGLIAGGRQDANKLFLWPYQTFSGDRLEKLTVMEPDSYAITLPSGDVVQPTAVHRKSKPLDKAIETEEQPVRHIIYLVLPKPLEEGGKYTVAFPHLNTRETDVPYTHDSRTVRTEAIHTNHVGHRPDDPFKRAFLSLWMGDKRAHTFDGIEKFELIDPDGKAVFEGPVEMVLAVDGIEKVRPEKNLSQTAVYAMDFSKFDQPGTYRVHIPGLGVSYPVEISDTVWRDAFKKSMNGFLAQRSGIALGPPLTKFTRQRDLHPEDGVTVYQTTTLAGNAFDKKKYQEWFPALVEGRTDETVPGAWGGYHDAGDFDRSSSHLQATYLQLELLDLFPEYFEKLKLALPGDEPKDNLPDVLNEALWNIDLFRRLQSPDGGVSSGIESSSHPRRGEDSVHDSLLLMTYAPEKEPSYTYAFTAARAARLMKKYDANRAQGYADTAIKAFEFAEKAPYLGKGYGTLPIDDARNIAAAEMLMLTGDPKYDAIFKETSQWGKNPAIIEAQGGGFTYARLPDGVGDPALKAEIVKAIEKQADLALLYGDGNAFGLTVEVKDLPLIGPVGAFTVPGMFSRILPRAHYLTGKEKYLSGLLRATNFSVGANPDNRAFTTGVGFDPPISPLHFDSRLNGQLPPDGLSVYGAYEPESLPVYTEGNDWVHIWKVGETMFPASRTWPSTEFYVDLFLWPMMNEFTIVQNMGPTAYSWGYLAARPAKKSE